MEKLLIPRKEAAALLSISVDMLDELRKVGEIRAVTIGSRVYFSPEELRAFVMKDGELA